MAFDITADLGQLRRKKLFDGFGNFDMPDMGNLGQDDQQDNPYKDLFKANMPSSVSDVSRVSTQPDDPDDDFISRYVKARGQIQPETTATDRFNALLDKFPERQPPSIARRLVAMGAGFGKGGIDESRKIMEEPYMRDINAWKEQTTPQYNAANLERQSNVNERTLLGQMLSADTANRRTVSAEKKYRDEILSREKIAGDKNETARIRADAYAYSQRLGKGWDWDLTGPTAKKINKSTGEVIDTGLETGKMDERTKIELQNEGRVAAAEASGMSAIERTQAAGGQMVVVDGKPYYVNPRNPSESATPAPGLPGGNITKPGSPGGKSGGGMLEQTREEQKRMQDLYELDESARKYITKNPNSGKFTLKTRPVPGTSTGLFGMGAGVQQSEADEWDAVKAAISPGYSPPAPKPNTTSITVPPEQLGRTPAAGRGTQSQGGNVGPDNYPTQSPKLYSPQEIQQMSPQEKRQRAIGFLIERNLPTDEQNIQHAIQTGRILRDQR